MTTVPGIACDCSAGKTAVITARVAWQVEKQGGSPDNQLVISFTNKAADECKVGALR
jgi:superfamily I DNA/RNA helicase